jgi:Protein of unknown function (DUF3592)
LDSVLAMLIYHPTGGRSDKIVGAFLILVALGMAGFGIYTAYRWILSQDWPAVPCVITASRVQEVGGDKPYQFEVQYTYSWQGRDFLGNSFREGAEAMTDIAEADRMARSHPVGARLTCYLNPDHPSQAILRHQDIRLPLFMVGFAVLAVWFTANTFWKGQKSAAVPGILFVALLGMASFVGFFGSPLMNWAGSLGWEPTPCVVQSAVLRSRQFHGEVSFTLYWPDIVYTYQVRGVPYRANTHNASFMGSPWYYGSRGVVRRHAPGKATVCYVDPADPSRAVLDRAFSGTQWFGVWPILMVAIALGALFERVTAKKLSLGTRRSWELLALAVSSAFTCLVLSNFGSDLLEDFRAGVAEVWEAMAVGAVGLIQVALLAAWTRVNLRRRKH